MIAIIDYDAGNIKSVEKALNYLGETACITRDRDRILHSDRVILPGVGNFKDAMQKLREYKLIQTICGGAEDSFSGNLSGPAAFVRVQRRKSGSSRSGIIKGEDSSNSGRPRFKDPSYGLEFPDMEAECQIVPRPAGESLCVFCSFLLSTGR